ncbi:unnamed protein product [Absidia cylindrospora]
MLKNSSSLDRQLMLLAGTVGVGTLLAWLATRTSHDTSLSLSSTSKSKGTKMELLKENSQQVNDDPRNFVKLMNDQNRNELIIFYGSQTGTGEDYAQRLGKECKKRYNIQPMVADIESYDLRYLDVLSKDSIVVFVISTYGEGDPTDSAVDFWELLHCDVPTFSKDCAVENPLGHLRYFIFGLGNRTYEYFNGASIAMDKKLTKLGATRLGELGAGDDDASLEDDFMAWQEQFWPLLSDAIVKSEDGTGNNEQQQHRAYTVKEKEDDGSFYYMGELGDPQLTTWSAKRPYPAPVDIYDLTPKSRDQRHCLHVQVDLSNSNMSYTTGDHLGIWPTNNELEISLVASLFGWNNERLDKVISVLPTDPTNKPPFPQPTTLRAALRHYLDLAQLPSRSTIELLVHYCSDDKLKSFLQNLIDDKADYKRVVLDGVRNLGQLLSFALLSIDCITPENALQDIPLDVVLECYSRLQPRYYSISSSSSESATKVTATAVTLQYNPTPDRTIYGVNTNYLWAINERLAAATSTTSSTETLKYMIEGPRQQYLDQNITESPHFKIPVHLRKSTFRLPTSSSTPVIMVGPGTGVAPFRGFIRERVYQKQVLGEQVGTTVLFFGCRRSTEDYLYADEWPGLFAALEGDNNASRIITAFSREPGQEGKKVYVQHRLAEHGEEMWDLLANHGAHFYVCGDAKYMAKDVQQAVMDMAQSFGGLTVQDATAFVQTLRKSNRYVEDIWA